MITIKELKMFEAKKQYAKIGKTFKKQVNSRIRKTNLFSKKSNSSTQKKE